MAGSLGGSVRQDALEIALADEYPARFRTLVAGDDPAPLEHVDEAPGARVADAQAPLDERDRRGLGLHDDLDRALEERVLVGVEILVLVLVLLGAGRLEERLVELLAALRAALLDDESDLLLAHVRALDALEP